MNIVELVSELIENSVGSIDVQTDEKVYSPSEDSYLLLDSMKISKGDFVLDMGTGTGILAMQAVILGASKVVAIDINPFASRCAMKNVLSKGFGTKISILTGDLFSLLRATSVFDIILFNPPYLRTAESEYTSGWLEKSWAGGRNGRVVIDRFIEKLPTHLRSDGIVFMLQPSNVLSATIRKLRQMKMSASVVARRKLFFEELLVLSVKHSRAKSG
jgi:release factor glutamine methyltransferase